MAKAIMITELAEILNVRLRCKKCGESVLVDVNSGEAQCKACGNPFSHRIVLHARRLKQFAAEYRADVALDTAGADVWLESDAKTL